MVQSITSNLPAQALSQLSVSPARNTEPLERLTTGPRAFTPAETEPNGASVKTSSINPLMISASFDQTAVGHDVQPGKSLVQPSVGDSANRTFVDPNEEAKNAAFLRIRQSLSASALSIANQAGQSILQLLR
jgi:hypothetical protein